MLLLFVYNFLNQSFERFRRASCWPRHGLDMGSLFYLDKALSYCDSSSYRVDKQIDKSYLPVYQNI